MGRINLNRLRYVLQKNIKWIIPRKYRKPFYLVCSIVGVITYFNVMLYWSNSKYLYLIRDFIISFKVNVLDKVDPILVYGALGLFSFIVLSRYFRVPGLSQDDGEKKSNGSLYYEVNAVISLCYLVITIASFLGFVSF